MIDSKQAAATLSDIDDIVCRVRQSRIYNLASLIMICWGVLVSAGNVLSATFLLWMAVVNGFGLILGGLWMRRS
jgi:polyferredoxin